ncbi:hypothetical protein QE152_g26830 [Popillia japonica]|uniref:Uncharacterized protein n=1 Tax=Popillia japonica TaxID=7064 RepID=A0AAW1JXI0_POPJA
MPNLRGARASKRRILASVVHSQLLYGAPAWHTAVDSKRLVQRLSRVQRKVNIRVCSAYRTISAEGVTVIAGISPIELQVKEWVEVYNGTARNIGRGSNSYSRNFAYRTASEGVGRSIQRNGEEYRKRTPYSKVAIKLGLREIWALDLATDSQHTNKRTPYSKVAIKLGLREIWALDLATDSQHTKMAQKTGRS